MEPARKSWTSFFVHLFFMDYLSALRFSLDGVVSINLRLISFMHWGDSRDTTTRERQVIGFDGVKNEWREAEAVFNESALTICGHPVMEDWEDGYMKMLADIVTIKTGRILEVGFGLGISASYIQRHAVEEHVIIEANRDVFRRLEKYGEQASRPVKPLFGFWEDIVPELDDESFAGILFDTYPLTREEVHLNHFSFFAEAYRLLRPGGVLTYYSDEPTVLSKPHLETLERAGFLRSNIHWRMCNVDPPVDCQYWRLPTIVAPIITKQ